MSFFGLGKSGPVSEIEEYLSKKREKLVKRKEPFEMKTEIFDDFLNQSDKNQKDALLKKWDDFLSKMYKPKNQEEVIKYQKDLVKFVQDNYHPYLVEFFRREWIKLEKLSTDNNQAQIQRFYDNTSQSCSEIPMDEEDRSMPIRNSYELKFQQVDKQSLQQAMKLDYYMVQTYEIVVKAFCKLNSTNREDDSLALNIAVDNSWMQFSSCIKQYPKHERSKLEELLRKMQALFEGELQVWKPTKEICYEVSRFRRVLQGCAINFTKIETVNAIHPSDVMKLYGHIQTSQHGTDLQLGEISKRDNYQAPVIYITQNNFNRNY